MIHYHGLPITPDTAAVEAVINGHAFISYRHPRQLGLALQCAQSFALDNGAFSAWASGSPVTDWRPFYRWVEDICRHPGFDWAVIPDVIDGDEAANDALLAEWPHGPVVGVPVWHMHEPYDRLLRLVETYPRVCLGSSGAFSRVGTAAWWERMHGAMRTVCDEHGLPRARLHGLRMLNPQVFAQLPLASADSTNIGRNIGIDAKWRGTYTPPTKEARARVMRSRIESVNGASRWVDPATPALPTHSMGEPRTPQFTERYQ